mgnify:CR=1 FL=1
MNKQYHFVVIAVLFLSTACSATLRSTKVINSSYKNPETAKKIGLHSTQPEQPRQVDNTSFVHHERIWDRTHADVLDGLEIVSQKEPVNYKVEPQPKPENLGK